MFAFIHHYVTACVYRWATGWWQGSITDLLLSPFMLWAQFIVMVQQWNYFVPVGSDDSTMKREDVDDAAIALFQEPDDALEMMPVTKKIYPKHRNSIVINLLDQLDDPDNPNESNNLRSPQHKQTDLNQSLNQLDSSDEIKTSAPSSAIATADSPDIRSKPATAGLTDQGLLEQNQQQGAASPPSDPDDSNPLLSRMDELVTKNDELKAEVIRLKRYSYYLEYLFVCLFFS